MRSSARFLNRPDLVDDVFQETFMQLYVSRDTFDLSRAVASLAVHDRGEQGQGCSAPQAANRLHQPGEYVRQRGTLHRRRAEYAGL